MTTLLSVTKHRKLFRGLIARFEEDLYEARFAFSPDQLKGLEISLSGPVQ